MRLHIYDGEFNQKDSFLCLLELTTLLPVHNEVDDTINFQPSNNSDLRNSNI